MRRRAGDHPSQSRGARVHKRCLSPPSDAGRCRAVSTRAGGDAPGPWQQSRDLRERDRAGIHKRDDGWVARSRRQDAGLIRIQRCRDARGRGDGPCQGSNGRRRAGRARKPGDRHGRPRRRARRRGASRPRAAAHRSGPGRGVRGRDGRGRAGRGDWHEPRRLQVQPQARRGRAGDGPHSRDPPPATQYAPGDARQLVGAAASARRDQRPRRRDAADVRRAHCRDSRGHSPWRAQDQRRHRQSHGHHGGHSQGVPRRSGRVRPAQIPEPGRARP